MVRKPLKRHEALIPLSKDHHMGLLLCWKIRMGLKKGLKEKRIMDYTAYFFDSHLRPHFSIEENLVFSSLPEDDYLRREAEKQHWDLYSMIDRLPVREEEYKTFLTDFEQMLEKHIRFEERELFMHIQEKLDARALEELRKRVEAVFEEVPEQWNDRFWE